jgi:hypothetical protein
MQNFTHGPLLERKSNSTRSIINLWANEHVPRTEQLPKYRRDTATGTLSVVLEASVFRREYHKCQELFA